MNNAPKIYKMRVVFTVPGAWDHKRIFAALRNMVLRSGLPFEPAKVNKNWPRLAYGPALGYGQFSSGEYADLYFSSPVKEEAAMSALSKAAAGITLLHVKRVPYALPSVSQLAEVMQYAVEGNLDKYIPIKPLEAFFGGEHIYLTVQAANSMTVVQDLKPFVLSVQRAGTDRLELLLQRHLDKTTKPEYLMAAWLNMMVPAEAEFTIEGLKFTREELYWRDGSGKLHVI